MFKMHGLSNFIKINLSTISCLKGSKSTGCDGRLHISIDLPPDASTLDSSGQETTST